MENATQVAAEMGGKMESTVDSVYLGGGTPTVLEGTQLERIFGTLRQRFEVSPTAEVTVECAPGTLTPAMVATLLRCGVNRVSLGVQSFVDQEAAAVGRLHKRSTVLADMARLRAAGITNINIDLIAGLPHQTGESWEFSVAEAIATGAPHVSVYMLEVDEDSRLGSELLAGGARYHAHFVPNEEAVTDFYLAACDRLHTAGVVQYEISNFAREGCESRHNLKYWTRQPYFGFGVDAHSMLLSETPEIDAVRFAPSDSLEQYTGGAPLQRTVVSRQSALEERFFLGLRLPRGVSLRKLSTEFGEDALQDARSAVSELVHEGLMEQRDEVVYLTSRGRLLSNEVFERFIGAERIAS
ncbi:MAG: oxygen-independent coproporphyrinogen oxidase [Acidobacteriaceae bacterium]|nr:oxygen-independent coproporphyrinogen oxidase [Acidobacteriaceae bacterium]